MKRVICIGSKNPVKISAVKEAALSYWGNIDFETISAPSRVSDMPFSKREARMGAKNRASYSINNNENVWLGVGNEGGVTNIDGVWYLFSTTCITDGKDIVWGGELLMRLPSNLVEGLKGGRIELGQVLDEITGRNNIKQKEGAVGILSRGAISRKDVFRMSALQAFSHWVEPIFE